MWTFKHKLFDCTIASQSPLKTIHPNRSIFIYHLITSPCSTQDILTIPLIVTTNWQLTNMNYIWNNIDHSFYTERNRNYSILTMLSITVDDLPLSYKNNQVGHKFWEKLSNAFYTCRYYKIEMFKLNYLSIIIQHILWSNKPFQTKYPGYMVWERSPNWKDKYSYPCWSFSWRRFVPISFFTK